MDMVFKLFKSGKRVDFDHIGLRYRMYFSLWLGIECSVYKEPIFFPIINL